MISIAMCGFITAATIFNGVLGGGNLAWAWSRCSTRKVRAVDWAAYSRHADLEDGFKIF